MSKITSVLWKLLGALLTFFVVTFTIYFFNLDMKLTSKIEPILLKHYDSMPRNTYI